MTPGSQIEALTALTAAIAARPPRTSPWPMDGRIQAAVCVPLHFGPRGLEIWAIKRTAGMRHHPREIAFPGGKPDAGDQDLADTALREMQEELGIGRDQVRVLGALAPVPTATSRFTLNPFVSLVSDGAVPRPHTGEVAVLIRVVVADFFAGGGPVRGVGLCPRRRSPTFGIQ